MIKNKEDLMSYINNMSIREKIGQCIMIEPVFCLNELNSKREDKFKSIDDPRFLQVLFEDYHVGFLLFGGITRLGNSLPIDWANIFHSINDYVIKNNHIPLFYGVDAVHGMNFVKNTTIFSHNLGTISTWNPELVKQYTNIVSKELHSIGMNVNFAPTIDVARDQRWGRVYESFGEDPYLASVMSEAMVTGFQEDNNVAACAKHFIGYGEASNGMDRTPANISERSLREIHMPPFKKAIEAGVKTIMVNGGDLNGVPVPASKIALTDMLRDELGFEGITMSDWEDVVRLEFRHHITNSKEDAIVRAFNAGLDMNMAVSDLETVDIMERLIKEGRISEERLNEAVTRILKVKFELGLFNNENIDLEKADQRLHLEKSKEIAKQITLESITLLKNEQGLLPLNKDKYKRILVTGKTANSKRHMCGGWTLNWASADEEDLDFPTLLDELKNYVSRETVIEYAPTIEELKHHVSKSEFDLIISVVGEEPHSEWLGDSFNLHIEQDEFDLLEKATEIGVPLVMVSMIGRPVKMDWIDQNVSSILWTYYPGSEGATAVMDVLFGHYSPAGRLPMTFPLDANQIPITYNARTYSSNEIETKYHPLYPFGYGLSYSTFEYTNLIVPNKVNLDEDVLIRITVENTGTIDADEVVQVYTRDLYASVTRPIKSLKAFTKVHLKVGEKKEIEIPIKNEELYLYDEYLNFVNENREVEIQVQNLRKTVKIG